MGRIDGLLAGEASGAIGDHLFNEEHEGETPLSELPHDPETILVDPNVPGPVDGVIEGVQPRERAPHLFLSLSPAYSLMKLVRRSSRWLLMGEKRLLLPVSNLGIFNGENVVVCGNRSVLESRCY